jgi:MYXO-CTERM domain-containing protein
MKTLTLALALLFSCVVLLNAAVILNDAGIEDFFGEDALVLTQSIPPGQGLFAITIMDQGAGDFLFAFGGIAEEYALFDAVAGLDLLPGLVSLTTPLVSNNGSDPGSALVNFALGETKYFGYWDDRTFEGTPDAGDNYGWVRLTREAGGLVVSEGATAVGGGIRVGTAMQIPEPSRGLLALIGFGAVVVRRRRHGDGK